MSDLSTGELHDYLRSLMGVTEGQVPEDGESINDLKAYLTKLNTYATDLPDDENADLSGGSCSAHTPADFSFSGDESISDIKAFITDPGRNYPSCSCNALDNFACFCDSRCSCDTRCGCDNRCSCQTNCACDGKDYGPNISGGSPSCSCDNRIFACQCRGRCECVTRQIIGADLLDSISGCSCNNRCRCNAESKFS